jgi:hypothetical protein
MVATSLRKHECVRLLLADQRVKVNQASADGKTPLSVARGECRELLLADLRVVVVPAVVAFNSATGGVAVSQTEEQMLALAIQLSIAEASQQGEHAPTEEESEQTELAKALALSMSPL